MAYHALTRLLTLLNSFYAASWFRDIQTKTSIEAIASFNVSAKEAILKIDFLLKLRHNTKKQERKTHSLL